MMPELECEPQPNSARAVSPLVAHEVHQSTSLTDVVFRVEDHLFRVPIQMFCGSERFYSLLQTASSDGVSNLEGIEKEDFLNFMRYMNPRRLTGEITLDPAAYTSVLRFSTEWMFGAIRTTVILDFPSIDVVDKIVLARDCCVEEWLVPSINTYTRLARSISLQDVERLGSEYILKIVQLRENMQQTVGSCERTRAPMLLDEVDVRSRWQYDFTTNLKSLFAEELSQLDVSSSLVGPSNLDDFCLVDIYFLVEDCIFKSYRNFFEIFPVFQDMFMLPFREDEQREGNSVSKPIRLEGITKVDFEPFVELLNPRPCLEIWFSRPQWISVLKLSTMWEFTGIRQFAIDKISALKMGPVLKICLAKDYRVRNWLIPALCAYAARSEPVTIQDVDLLGWPYIIKILQARERISHFNFTVDCQGNIGCGGKHNCTYAFGTKVRSEHDFTKAVEHIFRDEIERIRHRDVSGATALSTKSGAN